MPDESGSRLAIELSAMDRAASVLVVAEDPTVGAELAPLLEGFGDLRQIGGGGELGAEAPDVAILVLTGSESDLEVLLTGVVLAERQCHSYRLALGPSSDAALIMDAVNIGRCESYHVRSANRVDLIAALARGLATARQRQGARPAEPTEVGGLRSTVSNLEGLLAATKAQLLDARRRLRTSQNEIFELELQASISQLVLGLAHELNNPLSVILGQAQRIQQPQIDPDSLGRRGAAIEHEVERCIALVQRLRSLAVPPGEAPAVLEIAKLVDIARNRLQERGVNSPRVDCPAYLPSIHASRRAYARILEVVLENATEAGAREIRIGGEIRHDRALITVDNDGATPGDEEIAHALRPFFTTRSDDGHQGLGLALASALIRDMGGSITLDRHPDGTGARISLTCAAAAHSDPSPARGHRVIGSSGHRVLVVDDEPLVAELIDDLLRDQGHEAVVCGSLAEAHEQLAAQRFSAVLCDLHLPDGAGTSLIASIAHDHPDLRGRFVLLTGDTSDPEVVAISRDHACPVIGKPFHLADMQQVLERVL